MEASSESGLRSGFAEVRHASFAEFEMGGPVMVKVRNCRADALGANGRMAVKVKPASRGIVARQVDERTVEFALQRPEFLSVEFNGERKQNLHVFANAMLTETYTGDEPGTINWTAPNAQDIFMQDARLIYFGPGVHKPKDLPSGEIKIPSHTTVYLAPGAVVRARLIVDRAEDVRIIGRGIIAHPLRGIEITYSKDVLVDGVTVLNPQHYTVYGGQSENITIRNLKSFSARPWSDGIDLMCCRHVKIHNVFLRNSDDCIAFTTTVGGIGEEVVTLTFRGPLCGATGRIRSISGRMATIVARPARHWKTCAYTIVTSFSM